MGIISNLINNAIIDFFTGLVDAALSIFTAFAGNEMAVALQILETPYIQNAIVLSRALAGTLLGVKVAAEAFKTYILYSSGDPGAEPLNLLRRAAFSAFMVGAGPWAVENVYKFGNDIAKAIAMLPSTSVDTNPLIPIFRHTAISVPISSSITLAITAVISIIIWALILIQTGIRAVEIAFLAVSGPIMAVGLTLPDEGVWSVWWRELIVLSISQAVQTFMIRGFLSTAANIFFSSPMLNMLMLIGWLWVAFKTPAVLRQFAYHSGMGSAIGHAGQTAGSMYILRRMMMRG
jgi:hypothetical protein